MSDEELLADYLLMTVKERAIALGYIDKTHIMNECDDKYRIYYDKHTVIYYGNFMSNKNTLWIAYNFDIESFDLIDHNRICERIDRRINEIILL